MTGMSGSTKREQIEAVLARIRPLFQADGVDLQLLDVRADGASVRVTGLCDECRSASFNCHAGLEALLREQVDEFGCLQLVTTM